jgi:hypothetical protein
MADDVFCAEMHVGSVVNGDRRHERDRSCGGWLGFVFVRCVHRGGVPRTIVNDANDVNESVTLPIWQERAWHEAANHTAIPFLRRSRSKFGYDVY